MTLYFGTDIIEISRIRKAMTVQRERFLNRVYTHAELSLCGNSAQSLAVRFACKEAVMKLLGAKGKGFRFRDIETLSLPDGRPVVNLYGRAKEEAESLGIKEITVSLSHSRSCAIASAVAAAE